MRRDFVATVYVVKDGKILLHKHKKLNRWLPPGGHIEENELPDEAAIREVKEECGIDIELVGKKATNYKYEDGQAVTGLHNPMLIQLEDIPAFEKEEAHQHIDLIYAAVPKSDKITDGRWMSLEEIRKEGIEEEIYIHAEMAIDSIGKDE